MMKNIKLDTRIIKADGKISGNYVKGKRTEKLIVELTFEEAQMIADAVSDRLYKHRNYLENFCLKCELKKIHGPPEKKQKKLDRDVKYNKRNLRISNKITKIFWPWAKYDW